MKILVTGGAGYIGSHTIVELFKAGAQEVISVDNYARSTPESLERVAQIAGKRAHNHTVDATDLPALQAVFDAHPNIDGIIHFAALKTVPESVKHPLDYYRNNLQSLVNALQCAVDYNVPRFVFSSSCSVYGNISQLPVSEATPLQPAQSPYAQTKRMGEQMLADVAHTHANGHFVVLRYFNPAGAHESGLLGEWPIDPPQALVPVICQTAAGLRPELTVFGHDYDTRDGTCVRDYVHVVDIARAHVQALGYTPQASNFDIINLGSGSGTTVLEAIDAFEKVSGQKLPYTLGPRRPGDVKAIYSDCALAEKLLGWKPQHGIIEMMESAWKWQQTMPQRSLS